MRDEENAQNVILRANAEWSWAALDGDRDGTVTVNTRWRDRDTIFRLEFRNPRLRKKCLSTPLQLD